MPDSCQPFSAVDFSHTDCKKKVLLLGSRAHLVSIVCVGWGFQYILDSTARKLRQEEWLSKGPSKEGLLSKAPVRKICFVKVRQEDVPSEE